MEIREQWSRIKEIVGAALEREPDERNAFLDQACSLNPALRAQVDSLLAAHAEADALFRSEHPHSNTMSAVTDGARTIGPYQLIRELGAGGMGQVWLAEQTDPVRRRVALKLIKAGMYDASIVRRFQAERQSLALMYHPTIAKGLRRWSDSRGPALFRHGVRRWPFRHRLLRSEETDNS